MKTFAVNNLNVTQNIKFVFLGVENIVGKEETTDYQHFLLSSQCFHYAFTSGPSEVPLCGKGLTFSQTSPGFYMSAVQVF